MHLIVTHSSPDLDAICSSWLLKRFHPKYTDAEMRFVPAGFGYTLTSDEKQKKAEFLIVDTGGGELDHHQTGDLDKCASSLVLDLLFQEGHIDSVHEKRLRRMVDIVLEIDHFKEIFWEDPANDRYLFFLEEIITGLRLITQNEYEKVMNFGFIALDAIYQKIKFKIMAEEEIEKAFEFFIGDESEVDGSQDHKNSQSKAEIIHDEFLKGIAIETSNDEVLKLAQKKGYQLVIRKDPKKSYVRIKTIPNGKVDLTNVYFALQKKDPEATWFLHASKCIVLNGSTKNPDMVPTKLQLSEIVEIVKENV